VSIDSATAPSPKALDDRKNAPHFLLDTNLGCIWFSSTPRLHRSSRHPQSPLRACARAAAGSKKRPPSETNPEWHDDSMINAAAGRTQSGRTAKYWRRQVQGREQRSWSEQQHSRGREHIPCSGAQPSTSDRRTWPSFSGNRTASRGVNPLLSTLRTRTGNNVRPMALTLALGKSRDVPRAESPATHARVAPSRPSAAAIGAQGSWLVSAPPLIDGSGGIAGWDMQLSVRASERLGRPDTPRVLREAYRLQSPRPRAKQLTVRAASSSASRRMRLPIRRFSISCPRAP